MAVKAECVCVWCTNCIFISWVADSVTWSNAFYAGFTSLVFVLEMNNNCWSKESSERTLICGTLSRWWLKLNPAKLLGLHILSQPSALGDVKTLEHWTTLAGWPTHLLEQYISRFGTGTYCCLELAGFSVSVAITLDAFLVIPYGQRKIWSQPYRHYYYYY